MRLHEGALSWSIEPVIRSMECIPRLCIHWLSGWNLSSARIQPYVRLDSRLRFQPIRLLSQSLWVRLDSRAVACRDVTSRQLPCGLTSTTPDQSQVL